MLAMPALFLNTSIQETKWDIKLQILKNSYGLQNDLNWRCEMKQVEYQKPAIIEENSLDRRIVFASPRNIQHLCDDCPGQAMSSHFS